MRNDSLILAEGCEVSLNSYETWTNNNFLIVGSSGSGKTRTIVEPNLYNSCGSYLISDPKGALYRKYGNLFRIKGYQVKTLNLVNLSESIRYNPLAFIHTDADILKVARILSGDQGSFHNDPFWDESAQILLVSLIYFLRETRRKKDQTIPELIRLLSQCYRTELDNASVMDSIMRRHKETFPDSVAVKNYEKISCSSRTYNCIVVTLQSKLGLLDCGEVERVLSGNEISFCGAGMQDTAIFVICSDTDRSLDLLAKLFFTQAVSELTLFADTHCENGELPVPVMFFLDDFATNVVIDDFPRSIATIRSRNISAVLMIQAESQLEECYGREGARTIIGNCDTYVYMGGNDLATARAVSERIDKPVKRILCLPQMDCIIFRRGETPRICHKYTQYMERLKRVEQKTKERIARIDQGEGDPYDPGNKKKDKEKDGKKSKEKDDQKDQGDHPFG